MVMKNMVCVSEAKIRILIRILSANGVITEDQLYNLEMALNEKRHPDIIRFFESKLKIKAAFASSGDYYIERDAGKKQESGGCKTIW